MNKKGLGRGLGSLIPVEEVQEGEKIEMIGVAAIEPNRYQPRQIFDDEQLKELAESIATHGILQPLIARELLPGYELIAGERRWRAAQIVGMTEVPVVVRQISDAQAMEIAIIENIQRADLNPIEEAVAFSRLITELGFTQEELSKRVSRSRPHVTNTLRLLQLSSEVQQYVSRGTLTMGHARALLPLEPDQQLELAVHVAHEQLSVRQAEELVKRYMKPTKGNKERSRPETNSTHRRWETNLKQRYATQVQIRDKGKGGKIEIDFYSNEDLERILELLLG